MGMVLMFVRHSMTFTSKDSYAIKRDFRYKFAMEDDELFIEDESSYGSENTYGDVVQENDDVRLRSVSVESISTLSSRWTQHERRGRELILLLLSVSAGSYRHDRLQSHVDTVCTVDPRNLIMSPKSP